MTLKTNLYQSQQLRQELKMNPRLYQAMELLYMPLLDLQQHLKQELTENPFLELSEPDVGEEVPLEESAADQEADDGIDWEEILLDGFETGGRRPQYEEREYYQPPVVSTRDLADHLLDQLRLLSLSYRERVLGEEIIGNIGDDGYLACSPREIVDALNAWLAREAERQRQASDGRGQSVPPQALEPAHGSEGAPFRGAAAEAGTDGAPVCRLAAEPPVTAADAACGAAAILEDAGRTADATRHAARDDAASTAPGDEWAFEPYTVEEAEKMLEVIQNFDPPGVGARDIRECLLLQLKHAGREGSRVHAIVRDHFDDLVNHRWAEIARALGISVREVQDAADEIAQFDPKPGLRYSPSRDEYVIPDLIVDKIDGEYMVFLNDTSLPRLRISRAYQEIARNKDQFRGKNKEFIANKLNSAQWMIQAIEQRRQTMLRVMHFIVDRQRDFLEKGVQHLRPLTLREVADAIGMHESTISRVTNEKYVQTPRGVFPLKFFFSSGLSTTTGEDISARGVKDKIAKLVADEDPRQPLTDQAIVEILKSEGVQIARRTVAKYRDQLGILPARMRKRV